MFAQAWKSAHVLLTANSKEDEKKSVEDLKASFSWARECKAHGAPASGFPPCSLVACWTMILDETVLT